MPRPMWSGALTFGLVNVPVKLFSAVSHKEIHFHMVHAKDGGRIRQKRVCEVDGEEVAYQDIAKGFEAAPGRMVLVDKKELQALAPQASRSIDITDFVDGKDIDPVYFENAYHLAPDKTAGKSYELLVAALHKTGKVGIARMVMRSKGYLCAIRAVGNGLMLSTMNYADEVIPQSDIDGMPKEEPKARERELAMAEQLIESLAATFEPERYRDEHREEVAALLEKKAEGQHIELHVKEEEPQKVVSLMDALQRSIEAAKKRKAAGGNGSASAGAGKAAANDDDDTRGTRRHHAQAARVARKGRSSPSSGSGNAKTPAKKRRHA